MKTSELIQAQTYLPSDLVQVCDEFAGISGLSRSSVIKIALIHFLNTHHNVEIQNV